MPLIFNKWIEGRCALKIEEDIKEHILLNHGPTT